MQTNLHYLKSISKISINSFNKNYEKQLATRHALQECIQICIDLAFHICMINKFGEPKNYKDAFKILERNHIISKKLAQKMQNWVGLRNIITHVYEEADNIQIFSYLDKDLIDFENFVKEISELTNIST